MVGGAPTSRSEYPYFARVGGFCGGTLVTPRRVLTAAHCSIQMKRTTIVRVGPRGVERRIRRTAMHPAAVRQQAAYMSDKSPPADLMLLELGRAVRGVPRAAIATPAQNLTRPGTPAVTIGAGATNPRGGGSGTFRAGEVEIQPESYCARKLQYDRFARRWSLCTLDPRARDPNQSPPFTSACFGDSGGPLIVTRGGRELVVGVASFGLFCGTRRDPEAYADATLGRDFVLDPTPVWAPQARGRARIAGVPRVGRVVRCAVDWLVPPDRVEYGFFAAGLRQSGRSPRYRIRPADAGERLSCDAFGRTGGGTGVVPRSPPVLVQP